MTRSSWTASGSYGILRFLDSGLVQLTSWLHSTGYNHSLTARDSIFATYNYSSFTIRLRLEFYQPERSARVLSKGDRKNVISGKWWTGVHQRHVDGAPQRKVQFAGNANLAYSRGRTECGSATYFAGATGGSGVLTGAKPRTSSFGGTLFCRELDDEFLRGIFQQQWFGTTADL